MSDEQFEAKQRAKIVQNWRRIADDLDNLIHAGIVTLSTDVGDTIHLLRTMEEKDVK